MRTTMLAVLTLAGSATAQTWTEVPDAGQVPGTAQVVAGSGTLTAIRGSLLADGIADLFQIYVSDWSAFSATTDNAERQFDTQLFLFTSSGHGIIGNDDWIGTSSLLPVGHALYAGLTPGNYYIGISQWDDDPTSAGGGIFTLTSGNQMAGPGGPGGASPLSGWSGAPRNAGNYRIDLTGSAFVDEVVIPLPSGAAMAGFGLLGLAGLARRRRA